MSAKTSDDVRRLTAALGARQEFEFVVLFGSRARGEAHPGSDWDVAYLGGSPSEADEMLHDLTLALATDRIDLVDLGRSSGLLRFRTARDGIPILENRPGRFRAFQEQAARFWCEAEPVLRRAFVDVLGALGPR